MNYYDLILKENENSNNSVLLFDQYTIGNLQTLLDNSQKSYFPTGSAYADVPVEFFFNEFFSKIGNHIRWISIGPKAYLTGIGEAVTKTEYFKTLEDFETHILNNYGHLLLYTVNKQVDTLNINNGYKWRIRFALVANIEDDRDNKIENIFK